MLKLKASSTSIEESMVSFPSEYAETEREKQTDSEWNNSAIYSRFIGEGVFSFAVRSQSLPIFASLDHPMSSWVGVTSFMLSNL